MVHLVHCDPFPSNSAFLAVTKENQLLSLSDLAFIAASMATTKVQ